MPANSITLELASLRSGDKVTGLSCGDHAFLPLKIFLEKHAKRFEEQDLSRTYLVRELGKTRPLGYVTLVCGEIDAEDGEDLIGGAIVYPYRSYPALKIARLLVDANMRRSGLQLGTKLLDYALGVAKTVIGPAAGCRFVVVDAKQPSIPFYEKRGFTLLDTPANRARAAPVMFLDLHKAA